MNKICIMMVAAGGHHHVVMGSAESRLPFFGLDWIKGGPTMHNVFHVHAEDGGPLMPAF